MDPVAVGIALNAVQKSDPYWIELTGGGYTRLHRHPGITPIGSEPASVLVRERGSHAPIAGVAVSIYDATGINFLDYGVTNGSGYLVLLGNLAPGLSLDPGSYVFRLVKSRYSFESGYPETVVHDGDNDFILEGSPLAPVPPPYPDVCLIYGWLYELNADPYASQKFHVRVYQPPRGSSSGVLVSAGSIKVETDQSGYFSFYALKGYLVQINVPQASLEAVFLVPDQTEAKITDLVKVG